MASTPTRIDADALHQLIAVRAYQMWEDQGRPNGCADRHWRQAEQDILACLPGTAVDAPAAATAYTAPLRR